MRKIKCTNTKGVSIEFGDASPLYSINKLDGLGVPDVSLQYQQAPFQDGETPLDRLLDAREITMEGIITSGLDLLKTYQYRREMCAAINTKLGELKITYTNDFGSWVIYGTPIGPIFANNNANDALQKYQITFHCSDPYWQDVSDTVVSISTGETKQINIVGDVESPVTIDMTGIGYDLSMAETVQDVSVMIKQPVQGHAQVTTSFGNKKAVLKSANDWAISNLSKSIRCINYNESYNIWVAVGEKGVILTSVDGITWVSQVSNFSQNLYSIAWSPTLAQWVAVGSSLSLVSSGDTETNIIQYLSTDSKFFSLQPGINVLTFLSSGGIFSGTITFRNRFLGV